MENTKKKVNKKPVLIAGIAMLLALVGCVGGMTYSKYVSSKTVPSTQATVAKWGYVITANSSELFANEYVTGASANTAKVPGESDASAAKVIVSADTSKSVVAPGATGSLSLTITGLAEVKAKINIALDVTSEISLTNGSTVYSPIKWTLNDGTTDLVKNKDLAQVQAKLNEINTANTSTINPGSASINRSYTLSYAWNFDNSKEDTGLKVKEADTKGIDGDTADTILGVASGLKDTDTSTALSDALTAAGYDYAKGWTISTALTFTLTASVTQVIA